jgi:G:T-mismatch repair DNA endonuclease (very short patch repair protein)
MIGRWIEWRPIRNAKFWEEKFATNLARDASRKAELEEGGSATLCS